MDSDKEKGMYSKYTVMRKHDPEGKHSTCPYFVLDLRHDKFSIPALKAYADNCAEDYPILASDIILLINTIGK